MGSTHGSLGTQRDVNGKIGRCKLLNMGLAIGNPYYYNHEVYYQPYC